MSHATAPIPVLPFTSSLLSCTVQSFGAAPMDTAVLVDTVAWAAAAFDLTFTWCSAGGRLDVQVIYKIASRSMVRRIFLLFCRALAKYLQDYSVTKRRKEGHVMDM